MSSQKEEGLLVTFPRFPNGERGRSASVIGRFGAGFIRSFCGPRGRSVIGLGFGPYDGLGFIGGRGRGKSAPLDIDDADADVVEGNVPKVPPE